jgi:hypothetical protein
LDFNVNLSVPLDNGYRSNGFDLREALSSAEETVIYWEKKFESFGISLPNKKMADALKSNLAYILINRDRKRLQPGSRNYDRAWTRDGAGIAQSLLRFGFREEVKGYIDWLAEFQLENGMIPFILDETGMPDWTSDWREYDSQGQYVFMIMEYFRYTKDRDYLRGKLDSVRKALEYLEEIRKRRLTEEYKKGPEEKKIFFGILPESNSHEGYFPPQHSYWDDFWAMKGWKDAIEMAGILGEDEFRRWAVQSKKEFERDLYNSLDLVKKVRNIAYIPGCAEKGDFDPTSTAIAVFPCGELDNLRARGLDYTFKKYYDETFLPRKKRGLTESFTPYEIRSASALLLMGERGKANELLEFFLKTMRPYAWNHWAEVVHAEYRLPQYVGDMPHSWVGAEFINALRNMLVYEDNGQLVLAAGVTPGWFKNGETVKVVNLPTYFGKISYTITRKGGSFAFTAEGSAAPARGFKVFSPVSGRTYEFSGLPRNLVLE